MFICIEQNRFISDQRFDANMTKRLNLLVPKHVSRIMIHWHRRAVQEVSELVRDLLLDSSINLQIANFSAIGTSIAGEDIIA